MLFNKKVAGVGLGIMMLLPLASFAQTTTPSVQDLLNKIKSLQAQIAALQAQQRTLIQDQMSAITSLAQTLRQGVSGDDVKVLQALLASDPSVYPEGLISGFYGPMTSKAVMRFQEKHGLEKVGAVGPKTLAKLNELLRESPIAWSTGSTTATSTRGRDDDEDRDEKRPCAIVPPGHLIAPGWLKKHEDDDKPIVPPCQVLPEGIWKKLNGTTTPPTPTSTPDVLAPVISSVTVTGVSSTTATIAWITNEAATGKIYFGGSNPVNLSSASTSSVSSSALTTSHSFGLSGLSATSTYYYVLESKDAANNTATTSTQSFVTTN